MKKKKWFGKAMRTAFTGIMIVSLAGCGSDEERESSQVSSIIEESSVQLSSESTEGEKTGPGSITYPLDTDITLSFWGGAPFSDAYQSVEDSPAHKSFMEAVGVDIDFQYIAAGAERAQAYNLLLSEEKLPNMIWNSTKPSAGAELIEDGVIYDLTEYLPLYAPDFWDFIHQPEQEMELKSILTADGAFYGLPIMYESDYGACYMGPIIRQDWLDECGLKVPVTMEEWENVLVTFKEKYNAKFGCNYKSYWRNWGFASGTDALGFIKPVLVADNDGKVVLAQAQEEWKEMMTILARWWDMGLIDEDTLTMDNDIVRNKILNNEIGVTFVPMSQMTNIINDAETEGVEAEWVAVGYPRTSSEEATSMIQTQASRTTGGMCMFTTSSSEEELAVALQVWNYAFTEEGMKYMAFGEEGKVHQIVDGEIFWVDSIANAELGVDYESKKYSMWANSSIPGVLPDRLVQLKNKEVVAEAPYIWTENTNAPQHIIPNIALTEDEKTTYSTYFTPISTYVSEEGLKFLTGSRSLDEYDDFVKTLYDMRLQDVLDVYQVAYDRFMNNQ